MQSPLKGSIAIVDDEANLRENVGIALNKEGFSTQTYCDGLVAWETFQASLPDLAILDIMMPRMDGLELCRRIRSISESLPIIFLTSKDEEFDRVLGLELGADDYLCKPFSMRELTARVKVLFRRLSLSTVKNGEEDEELLEIDKLKLDLRRYTATWNGAALALTVTEFMILQDRKSVV